jgi:hypothetical protein
MTDDDERKAYELRFGKHVHASLEAFFDKQQAYNEVKHHGIREAMLGMDEEQLRAVRSIVMGVLEDRDNGWAYIGSITTILDMKYNICLACAKDHDKNLQEMAEGEPNE